jgi:replicative DNA helicase
MLSRRSPHDPDTERMLLGGLILQESRLDDVHGMVKAEHFYLPEHQALYSLLLKMRQVGDPIDLTTVCERIQRDGKASEYRGPAYIIDLTHSIPSTENLEYYARLIREKALLRSLIGELGDLLDQAHSEPDDVGRLLDDGARRMFQLGADESTRKWADVAEVADDELVRISKLVGQTGTTSGYTTGFSRLDDKLAGLHPTDLLILAARPAMGKTALALNIALNVAKMAEMPVGIFSLEMGRGQLTTRLICCEALVQGDRVRRGQLDQDEMQRLLAAVDDEPGGLRYLKLSIDDTPGLTITELKARARRLKARVGDLGLIVVDYLQLMEGDDRRASRQQQISEISRGLKLIAKDLEVPVMALSQLNRDVEKRQDKRPMISDLRESGAIEQDADVIMFIYRDEIYNPDTEDKGQAEVIIAKQRNGPTGMVKLWFRGEYTRFDDVSDDPYAL